MILENFNLELRKINAIKINRSKKLYIPGEKTITQEVHVGLILEKDKKRIQINVFFRIPSRSELDTEIDAEFIGYAEMKEPVDIKDDEDIKKSPQLKDFIDTVLSLKITNELDRILSSIYDAMKVGYKNE